MTRTSHTTRLVASPIPTTASKVIKATVEVRRHHLKVMVRHRVARSSLQDGPNSGTRTRTAGNVAVAGHMTSELTVGEGTTSSKRPVEPSGTRPPSHLVRDMVPHRQALPTVTISRAVLSVLPLSKVMAIRSKAILSRATVILPGLDTIKVNISPKKSRRRRV